MEIIRNNTLDESSRSDLPLEKEQLDIFRVTDLKPALKNENRVNVFINDKFEFSLDLSQVVDLKLKKDKILSKEEIKVLREESEFGKLYQRTLEWVLTRPHSIKETKDYLKRCEKKRAADNRSREYNRKRSIEDRKKWHLSTKKLPEITPELSARVLDQLINRGFLDDQKFTNYYIENRLVKKGISHRRLEQELRKKGIANTIIQESLKNSSRSDAEEIKKLIEKKRKKYPDDQKLTAYLVRQGFPYDLVKTIVSDDYSTES